MTASDPRNADGPAAADCSQTVLALGVRGRRLAWGYGLYALYYLCIGGLVLYGGVQWSGLRQIAYDVVRLSEVILPLTGLITASTGLGVAVRYLVPMHPTGRWVAVAAAIALATVTCANYVEGVLRWAGAGYPAAGLYSQAFALVLVCGYVFLGYRLLRIVYGLHKFVLIEGMWLPKLHGA